MSTNNGYGPDFERGACVHLVVVIFGSHRYSTITLSFYGSIRYPDYTFRTIYTSTDTYFSVFNIENYYSCCFCTILKSIQRD